MSKRSSVSRLLLGIVLIAGASAVLLISDLGSRVGARPETRNKPKVALLQHASQAILSEGVQGILDGMAAAGYRDGETLELRRFNAEGDAATSNTIARAMATGDADLLITVSTPSLQAVANANRQTQKPHVFGLVTDPVAAGVGVSRTDPLDHPAWLAGHGTMQPVAEALTLARELNPALRTVGTVFNASEANSEAQMIVARRTCKELGLTLLEATVDNSSGVAEATASLCARGAEAIFVPGDVTVLVASETLIATANRAGVPVFTVIPPNARKGALFDLGANYYEVGRKAGELAGEILSGRSPASVPIVNFMPESLLINEGVLAVHRDKGWRLPDAVRERAQVLIDASGHETVKPATPKSAARTVPKRTGPARIEIICYMESLPMEETLAGFREVAATWPDKDGVVVKIRNAQGDMATLNGLVDAALAAKPDVLVPLSTPALQAVFKKAGEVPVVFGMVANPMAAGVATSYTEHPSHLTGVTVLAPAGEMLDLVKKFYPGYRRIGTLYCPAEANSVDLHDMLREEAARRGLEVESIAVATPGELADAAMSLASRPIDAIVQISDNLSSGGFTAITKAARQTGRPLFSLNSTTLPLGAAVVMGRDYHANGAEVARIVRRILDGESPAGLPIRLTPEIFSGASVPNAAALGWTLPQGLLDEMDKVLEK